jgi:hypothetical protein
VEQAIALIRSGGTPIEPEVVLGEIEERAKARVALEQERREAQKRERLAKLSANYKRREKTATPRQRAWRMLWQATEALEKVKHARRVEPVSLPSGEAGVDKKELDETIALRQNGRAMEFETERQELQRLTPGIVIEGGGDEVLAGRGRWVEFMEPGRFPPRPMRRWVPE